MLGKQLNIELKSVNIPNHDTIILFSHNFKNNAFSDLNFLQIINKSIYP